MLRFGQVFILVTLATLSFGSIASDLPSNLVESIDRQADPLDPVADKFHALGMDIELKDNGISIEDDDEETKRYLLIAGCVFASILIIILIAYLLRGFCECLGECCTYMSECCLGVYRRREPEIAQTSV